MLDSYFDSLEDQQKIRLVEIDYVYMVAEDGTENHFYDVFAELDGRRRTTRMRAKSTLGKVVYNIIFLLIQTLIDLEY